MGFFSVLFSDTAFLCVFLLPNASSLLSLTHVHAYMPVDMSCVVLLPPSERKCLDHVSLCMFYCISVKLTFINLILMFTLNM